MIANGASVHRNAIGGPDRPAIGALLCCVYDEDRQYGTRCRHGFVEFASEDSALTFLDLPFGVAPFALASQCVVLAIP
jgi:hypothetical protein